MSYINMSYIIPRTNSDDNNDSFVLDQHTELDYSASSLKQQSHHLDTLFWFRANQSALTR